MLVLGQDDQNRRIGRAVFTRQVLHIGTHSSSLPAVYAHKTVIIMHLSHLLEAQIVRG